MDLPVLVYDAVQQLAQADDTILDRFEIDVIDIGLVWDDKPEVYILEILPTRGHALLLKIRVQTL
jgi:hypothetical protein